MFIKNKYTNWYYAIINRSRINEMHDYTEKHHIIPKSLGGDNTEKNLVNLTAREHFICHWLLTKMTSDTARKKMIYALRMMRAQNQNLKRYNTKITARVYEKIKEENAKDARADQIGRISTRKGKTYQEIYGAEKASQLQQSHSLTMKGKNQGKTYEEIHGINKAKYLRELRANQKRGKPSVLKGQHLVTTCCPHCGKEGGINAMKRWHFNNCKHRTNEL